jgi:hypothetical protein
LLLTAAQNIKDESGEQVGILVPCVDFIIQYCTVQYLS